MSTSILLSLPATQMAASWIGNEAFTTAISSIACVTAVSMAKKEDDPKLAFLAGIFSGLALASKYTGIITIIGLFAANYNLSTHRLRIRNVFFAIIGFILIATPVIYRNINADCTIFPMTRNLPPIAKLEAKTQVNRSVWNYLTFNFKCLSQPIIYNYENKAYNKHMESVWGLTYSGLWYDPFEHRLQESETMGLAKMLPWLGLCPTIILLIGFIDAIRDLIRSKLDQSWFPLLATSIFGLLIYIYWTWHAHTLVAIKGSYLLPLILPAAAFFARGLQRIKGKFGFAMIMLCSVSVLMNGIVFMEGLFYSTPQNYNNILIYGWMNIAYEMPYSGIYETIVWFIKGL
jgi:4-amino-4-deoxy-L-arabinose transferase-like glycosyltransferase